MLARALASASLLIATPALAQDVYACPDEVEAWASDCDGVRPVSCPAGHVIVASRGLRVDVTVRGEHAFATVGELGASPIGQFADWREAPRADRDAFEAVVRCLRARPEPIDDAIGGLAPAPRGTEGEPTLVSAPLQTPWRALLGLAIALALVLRERGARRTLEQAMPLVALGAVVMLARALLVPEAYFHQNGQGPVWIAHALGDPSNYGPGYAQIFGVFARGAADPDGAVFFVQSVLCALVPPAVFVLVRCTGASRALAWAAALAVALSPIEARLARSESYFATCGALLVIAAAILSVSRGRTRAIVVASVAAGLLVAQAALVHPLAWLAAALLPLVVLVGEGERRARLAAISALVVGLTVLAFAGLDLYRVIDGPLGAQWLGPARTGDARHMPGWIALAWTIAAASLVLALRFASLRRLGLALAALSVVLGVAWRGNLLGAAPPWVHEAYRWLYLGPALAAGAALLRELLARVPEARARVASAAAVALVLAFALAYSAETYAGATRMPTDAREALLVRSWRAALPDGAAVAYLSRAERQIVGLPLYEPRHVRLFADAPLPDLTAIGRDVFYVRASLCTSERGRAYCDALEDDYVLEPVRRAVLPAIWSMEGLEYDRDEVEVVLYRVTDRRSDSTTHAGSSAGREGR